METIKFDKFQFFNNVTALLEDSDVKIGEIEAYAGCQKGYMSRLNKADNNTLPSIEFILAASKLFDISVDSLINLDLSKFKKKKIYFINFFEKIKENITQGNARVLELNTENYDSTSIDRSKWGLIINEPFSEKINFKCHNIYASIDGKIYAIDLGNNQLIYFIPCAVYNGYGNIECLYYEVWFSTGTKINYMTENSGLLTKYITDYYDFLANYYENYSIDPDVLSFMTKYINNNL